MYNLFPDLVNVTTNKVVSSIEDLSYDHDLYFIALPHGESLKYVPQLIDSGKKGSYCSRTQDPDSRLLHHKK